MVAALAAVLAKVLATTSVFTVVGAVVSCKWLADAVSALYVRLTKRRATPAVYGPWAIVTGCTAGLGEGFAGELSRRGYDLCLISRVRSRSLRFRASLTPLA